MQSRLLCSSAVSYPSPYRLVTLQGNRLSIRSYFIEQLPTYQGELPFPEYSKTFLETGVQNVASAFFPEKLPTEFKQEAARLIASYMVRSYRGDEQLTTTDEQDIRRLSKRIRKHSFYWAKVFKAVAHSLLTDLTPADNDIDII